MSLETVPFIMINCLFLYSAISTAAIEMLMGESGSSQARIPEIMGDAAYAILTKSSRMATGQFFIDEYIVQKEGITDLTPYSVVPGERVTCRQNTCCMYRYVHVLYGKVFCWKFGILASEGQLCPYPPLSTLAAIIIYTFATIVLAIGYHP